MLYENRRPSRVLFTMEGPREHTLHPGYWECSAERGIRITKQLSDDSPVQASADNERGGRDLGSLISNKVVGLRVLEVT